MVKTKKLLNDLMVQNNQKNTHIMDEHHSKNAFDDEILMFIGLIFYFYKLVTSTGQKHSSII